MTDYMLGGRTLGEWQQIRAERDAAVAKLDAIRAYGAAKRRAGASQMSIRVIDAILDGPQP